MRRFVALAVVAVLLCPAVAFGTLWNVSTNYLTEPSEGFYSQSAWSPWSAGYMKASDGSFNAYDSYHLSAGSSTVHPEVNAGMHGAWYMDTSNAGYGPDKQGAVCKDITASPMGGDTGAGGFFYEEPGQVVMLTGNVTDTSTTAVRWTAPAAGTYYLYARFTGQKFGSTNDMITDVAVKQGSSDLFSGTLTGFIGTAANSYADASAGKVNSLAYYGGPVSMAMGDVLLFQQNWETSRPGTKLHWTGLEAIVSTSPIPEPGTIILLTTSLVSLLAYAWRKRK
jgi:hypothetical protein